MNNVVKIEGLHCPNCARNLQNELNKIKGVTNVQIDVVKGTLTFDSKSPDQALTQIIKVTKGIEPDVTIIAKNTKSKPNKKLWFDLGVLVVGIALAVVCCTVTLPTVWFWVVFVSSALLLGYQTYIKAIKLLFKGIINENFLLTISVVGAAILGEYMESLMVIALYSIGKVFEGLAVSKSRKSIEKLTNLQAEYAVVLRDGKKLRSNQKTCLLAKSL